MINTSHLTAQARQDTTKEVIIENADYHEILLEADPPIQKLIGNVRAYHEGAFFYCDSAIIVGKNLFAYSDVIIVQNDTTEIFGDSLIYKGIERTAFIQGQVIFINGRDSMFTERLDYDLNNEVARFDTVVQLVNQGNIVKSKTAIYNVSKDEAEFYNSVSVEGDNFLLLNDTLLYDSENRITRWNVPTQIEQDSSQIYSEEGFYDLNLNEGEFYSNVVYKDTNSTSSADTIKVKQEGDLISLIGSASYFTESDTAYADSIIVNKVVDVTRLIGSASYSSPENEAEGELILYDNKNDNIELKGASTISDEPVLISGQDIKYNKKTKEGIIVGAVVWKDTSSNVEIQCDSLDYNGEEGYAIAIGFEQRPLLMIYPELDTTFISADTLRKNRIVNVIDTIGTLDSIDYMIGDNNVKIFSYDYQAVSDTLSYNLTDSVITLTQSPIMWTDTTQMTGDTIDMFIRNDKLSSMQILNNSYILNSPDLIFFNQIKGRKIDVDFKDSKIKKMKVQGNSESLYYMLDDENAYIGVNELKCSFMIFDFEDGDLYRIGSYTQPESVLHPMEGTNHESLKLQGFQWLISRRPLTPFNLRDKQSDFN